MERQLTMDVKFSQLSLGMLFYWQGHVFEKIKGDKGRKRTTETGEQINDNFLELAFDEDTKVVISKQDRKDLRFEVS